MVVIEGEDEDDEEEMVVIEGDGGDEEEDMVVIEGGDGDEVDNDVDDEEVVEVAGPGHSPFALSLPGGEVTPPPPPPGMHNIWGTAGAAHDMNPHTASVSISAEVAAVAACSATSAATSSATSHSIPGGGVPGG